MPKSQLYHNYLRPHSSLNNNTPADRSGIKIEGDNKWITIIQNASKNSDSKKKMEYVKRSYEARKITYRTISKYQ